MVVSLMGCPRPAGVRGGHLYFQQQADYGPFSEFQWRGFHPALSTDRARAARASIRIPCKRRWPNRSARPPGRSSGSGSSSRPARTFCASMCPAAPSCGFSSSSARSPCALALSTSVRLKLTANALHGPRPAGAGSSSPGPPATPTSLRHTFTPSSNPWKPRSLDEIRTSRSSRSATPVTFRPAQALRQPRHFRRRAQPSPPPAGSHRRLRNRRRRGLAGRLHPHLHRAPRFRCLRKPSHAGLSHDAGYLLGAVHQRLA